MNSPIEPTYMTLQRDVGVAMPLTIILTSKFTDWHLIYQ